MYLDDHFLSSSKSADEHNKSIELHCFEKRVDLGFAALHSPCKSLLKNGIVFCPSIEICFIDINKRKESGKLSHWWSVNKRKSQKERLHLVDETTIDPWSDMAEILFFITNRHVSTGWFMIDEFQ